MNWHTALIIRFTLSSVGSHLAYLGESKPISLQENPKLFKKKPAMFKRHLPVDETVRSMFFFHSADEHTFAIYSVVRYS